MDILPLRNPLRGEHLHVLIEKLDSQKSEDRYLAAQALGERGLKASSATKALLEKFKDKNSKVRYFAIQAIGNITAEPTSVIFELIKKISKDNDIEDKDLSHAAFRALVKLGRRFPKQVVPLLINQLSTNNHDFNEKMSKCLLKIGEKYQPKLYKYLGRACRSNSENLRQEAEKLLEAIEQSNLKRKLC